LSKIKIVEKNNLLVDEANRIIEKILSMQSEAESQIRDIKSIEKKILDIQKKKQIEETLLSEKKEMEKIIEIRKKEEAMEPPDEMRSETDVNEKAAAKETEAEKAGESEESASQKIGEPLEKARKENADSGAAPRGEAARHTQKEFKPRENRPADREKTAAAESGRKPASGRVIEIVRERNLTAIIVSNEVGMGVVPAYPMGRMFRDVVGRANKRIAAAADEAYLIVSGIPLKLK